MKNRQAIAYTGFAIIALIAIYGLAIVRRGFSAKDQPSALEVVVARSVRNLSFAINARNQHNPFPASAENLREGMEHFADHCAFCHVNDGSGIGDRPQPVPQASGLAPGADAASYRRRNIQHHREWRSIYRHARFDHEPDDDWRLVLFIRHLPQLSANEQREMERINPNSGEDQHHHHIGEQTH